MQILKCPNCGASADGMAGECNFCLSPFILKCTADFQGKSAQVFARYEQQYKGLQPGDAHYIECQVSLIRIYLQRKLWLPADALSKKCLAENPDQGELYISRAAVLMEKSRVKQMSLGAAREAAQLLATGVQLSADIEAARSLGITLFGEYFYQNGIEPPTSLRELLSTATSA